jgi:hypothetical protein
MSLASGGTAVISPNPPDFRYNIAVAEDSWQSARAEAQPRRSNRDSFSFGPASVGLEEVERAEC